MKWWGGAGGRGATAGALAGVLAVALAGHARAGVSAGAAVGSVRETSLVGAPAPYTFQPGARPVTGAATTSDARRLDAGATYRDSIRPGDRLTYRVDLDATSDAYVSAVAVPPATSEVAYGDRIKVSLQNRQGNDCSSNDARFGASAQFPRPLAAYAYRTIEKGAYACQEAGAYFVVVERVSDDATTATPWDLEIRHVREPAVAAPGGPTTAPSVWPSASPVPPAEGPRARAGGAGFYDAEGLTRGEWTARIEPGASLFYRVPVDWGQQLFVSADLGSSPGKGFVSGALAMSLYNPARGLVGDSGSVSYDGKQKTTALDPLPPVAYENRFGSRSGAKEMRFAGWYYLRVSLNPEVGRTFGAKPYGLTLRVNVEGAAKNGPRYAGPAGDFAVDEGERDEAAGGPAGPGGAADGGTMALVAAAGIGTGTLLVLWLGAWTLLARRRAARVPAGR
ncbi:hypothetical protein [Streptomyces liangshanensis]|uniref:hypothetical protein n=1 Tax=Streptomyces liangshanensis TaxID=2717324 RepID=UPI0036D91CFC